MWMTGRLRNIAVALALLAPIATSASDMAPSLSSRLSRIETAFRGGDAAALRSSLADNSKVRIDLKDLTDGPGSYGAGQLEVIFDGIFDAHKTREFTFRKQEVTVSGPGTAFARGRWVRRTGAQDTTATLTFTLREEAGDWRIHEIRSSR